MTGVWDPAGVLSSALAELPLSARRAEAPRGALVILPGADDWSAEASAAAAAGAAGILIVEPREARECELPVPLMVLRRRLAGSDSATAPATVVAEAFGPAPALEGIVRDAVGWIRTLAGTVTLRRYAMASGGVIALLEAGASRVPATLTVRALSGVPDGGVIRVDALSADRRQIVVDEPAGRFATAGGHESPERAALRRALHLTTSGSRPADPADLVADAEIARLILGGTE